MIQVTYAITAAVVMVVVIAAILVAVLVLLNSRAKERGRLYDLLNRAQEQNRPLPPEVIEQLANTSQTGRKNDVRRWIAVGAFSGLGLAGALGFSATLQQDLSDLTAALTFLSVVAALLAIVVVPQRNRMRERTRLYDLLAHAQEQGHPIPPEVVRQLTSSSLPAPERDIRRGTILLAIGAGLGVMTITAEVLSSTSFLFFLLPAGIMAGLGVAFLMLGRRRPPGSA